MFTQRPRGEQGDATMICLQQGGDCNYNLFVYHGDLKLQKIVYV